MLHPYKLMTFASLDDKNNSMILIGFVFFLYMDSISYTKIFKYLNENV